MPIIFSYFNYRQYLSAWFDHKKRWNPSFSYQLLANKAGFKSKSFFPQVLTGSKRLSQNSIFSLSKAMDLTGNKLKYFKTLVEYNQATTNAQKEHFFQELISINSHVKTSLLSQDQYDFFSHWYHATVRELITLFDWDGDHALLAKMVRPEITPEQACESVKLLEKLNLIKVSEGRWVQTDPHLSTKKTVKSLTINNFQQQNLQLAMNSISVSDEHERDLSCLVAGLSPEMYEKVKYEIGGFRKKLTSIISADKNPTRVYHINFQLFPTSEPKK